MSRSGRPYAEVIGDPIAHSQSPLIHGFWLAKLGIAGDYRRVLVQPHQLTAYLATRRLDPNWRGCNVTLPHKQAVPAFLDALDPEAATIGAVNTIARNAEGALTGFNTDAKGFLEPLRPLLGGMHLFRMARLLGTGGAAVAIAHALAAEGVTIVVIARDLGKARQLAASLPGDHHAASLGSFAEPTDFAFDDRAGLLDLVVNATTLGMTGQPPLHVDFSHIPPGSVVYDIVYTPLETPLLTEARRHGLRTIDGLRMLIGQAAIAFERLFGQPAPREHDAQLRELLTA